MVLVLNRTGKVEREVCAQDDLRALAVEYYAALALDDREESDGDWEIVERWSRGEYIGWFVEHAGRRYDGLKGSFGEDGPIRRARRPWAAWRCICGGRSSRPTLGAEGPWRTGGTLKGCYASCRYEGFVSSPGPKPAPAGFAQPRRSCTFGGDGVAGMFRGALWDVLPRSSPPPSACLDLGVAGLLPPTAGRDCVELERFRSPARVFFRVHLRGCGGVLGLGGPCSPRGSPRRRRSRGRRGQRAACSTVFAARYAERGRRARRGVGGGVPVGRTGGASWRRSVAAAPARAITCLIPGATGAGKTTSLAALLVDYVARSGFGAVVLEAKTDRDPARGRWRPPRLAASPFTCSHPRARAAMTRSPTARSTSAPSA